MVQDNTLIELREISYKYPNGTVTLEKITFEIKRGESIAILGPNGADKTTLLTLIAGLIKPSSGKIRYYFSKTKEAPHDSKDVRKKIGVVFQDPDPALLSNTVYEEIAFGALHLKWDRKEIIHRVDNMISLMNLEKVKNQHPFHLSEGKKRKFCLQQFS